jgi:exosortase
MPLTAAAGAGAAQGEPPADAVPAAGVVQVWRLEFGRAAQVKAALIAAAFIWTFWNLLDFIPPHYGALVHAWLHESDWSHGPIIPLFSIYLLYARWDRIRTCPVRWCWPGLALMLLGLAAYQWALWGLAISYARSLAMMLTLLGLIILLAGTPVLRHAWVPWAYLLFALPIPKGVYFALTDPLRRLAATVATGFLQLVTPVDEIRRVGSIIEYTYLGQAGTIGVVDACSGMRSIITLCALGVAVTFMSDRPRWQRVAMLAACVPIAITANFIRVVVTCVLHIFIDPRYAEGNYHTALGLVTLMIAFALFSGFGWLLAHLMVDEPLPEAAHRTTEAQRHGVQ